MKFHILNPIKYSSDNVLFSRLISYFSLEKFPGQN